MTFRLEIGAVHENGLSVAFTIYDDDDIGGDPSVEGSVNMDGCVNWQTDPDGLAHFCGPHSLDGFAACFRGVWDLARKAIAEHKAEEPTP